MFSIPNTFLDKYHIAIFFIKKEKNMNTVSYQAKEYPWNKTLYSQLYPSLYKMLIHNLTLSYIAVI